jgi:hypothetical protein
MMSSFSAHFLTFMRVSHEGLAGQYNATPAIFHGRAEMTWDKICQEKRGNNSFLNFLTIRAPSYIKHSIPTAVTK